MSSFRTRARRLAFGDSNENLSGSEASSTRSSSRSSPRSSFSRSPSRSAFRHSSSISEVCSCGGTNKFSDKTVRIPPRRTNRVRKIHRSEHFEMFVEALEQDGCVIVEDFVNPQIPAQVESAEMVNPTSPNENEDSEVPLDVNALIRESLLADSLYQTLSNHFLTLETISWKSKAIDMSVSTPQIFTSTTTDLNNKSTRTSTSSFFHRADTPLHRRHHSSTRYDYQSRRDVTLGLLVPELDSLSATIPLRVIPGSHLWDDQKPDTHRGVKHLDLQGGQALILLGSLYHALGHEDPISDRESSNSQKENYFVSQSEIDGNNGTYDGSSRRQSVSRTTSSTGSLKERLLHDMWMASGIYRASNDIVNTADEEDVTQ